MIFLGIWIGGMIMVILILLLAVASDYPLPQDGLEEMILKTIVWPISIPYIIFKTLVS